MEDYSDSQSVHNGEFDRKKREHRIYRHRVTGVIILACSLFFLSGLWISHVDLDSLVWREGMFNSKRHICLRMDWLNTTQGQADRVRLCTEWIDLSDLSGETHRVVLKRLEVIKGSDGQIRAYLRRGINFQLVAVSVFLVFIIVGGRWAQQLLIHRHKRQMGLI